MHAQHILYISSLLFLDGGRSKNWTVSRIGHFFARRNRGLPRNRCWRGTFSLNACANSTTKRAKLTSSFSQPSPAEINERTPQRWSYHCLWKKRLVRSLYLLGNLHLCWNLLYQQPWCPGHRCHVALFITKEKMCTTQNRSALVFAEQDVCLAAAL